jgi:hypothetical protein
MIRRDAEEISGLSGFTTQPMDEAPGAASDAAPNGGGHPANDK